MGRLRHAGARVYARPAQTPLDEPARTRSTSPTRSSSRAPSTTRRWAGATLASAVSRSWDLGGVAADYRRFLARFGGVIQRVRQAGDGAHDPAQSFIVRTLLIHAYRRVLLRDPQLPAALLPLDWPGAAAYALCRDFYRLTHRAAERHLLATLRNERDTLPPASPGFYRRFGGLDSRFEQACLRGTVHAVRVDRMPLRRRGLRVGVLLARIWMPGSLVMVASTPTAPFRLKVRIGPQPTRGESRGAPKKREAEGR